MTGYVNCYYAATLAADRERPALRLRELADVCIVGAGLAGLSTALELARHGTSVVVLEANRAGWGASGRNGGFVAAGFAEGLETLEKRVGFDNARALFDLSREGVGMVDGYIRDLSIETAQRREGCLRVVRHDAERVLSSMPQRLADRFGYEVDYWPTEKVRTHLRTETYFQGLYDAAAFHMHPLNYVAALCTACEEAGVRVYEGTAATTMAQRSGRRIVTTPGGSVEASHVVLCHSSYGAGLHARLDRAVLPVATYVVTTSPAASLVASAISTAAAVADTRRAGDYYRRLPDGRLLWGGRITTRRREPAALAAMLKSDIAAIYPQLANIEIDHAWSGLMAYAVHKMPIIGQLEPGLWAATGFGGHGLNTTAIAGRLIASAIVEGDDRYRLFEPFAMTWAGGSLGRAATQAVYWYYQLTDRLDEARARGSGRARTGVSR